MKDIYPDMTLAEWFPIWLDKYKRGTIKDTSLHQFEMLTCHIPTEIYDVPMCTVKPMQIQQFANDFAAEFSKSYTDKMRDMLRALFQTAIDNGLDIRNPTSTVKFISGKENVREAYSLDDVQKIIPFALDYQNKVIGIAVITLLMTGMRKGELLGLMRSDIYDHLLHINRSVYMKNNRPCFDEGKAKTKTSIRTIPLRQDLEYYISTLPKRGPLIFSANNGNIKYPRNFDRDYDRFFECLNESGVNVQRLPVHSCRHTFATLALAAGADLQDVRAILGHSDIRTTSRYLHPDYIGKRKAVDKLSSYIVEAAE